MPSSRESASSFAESASVGVGSSFHAETAGSAASSPRSSSISPDRAPKDSSRASAGLLFPEKHMLADEIELWEAFDTVEPAAILTLDDVPVVVVYRRGSPGSED